MELEKAVADMRRTDDILFVRDPYGKVVAVLLSPERWNAALEGGSPRPQKNRPTRGERKARQRARA